MLFLHWQVSLLSAASSVAGHTLRNYMKNRPPPNVLQILNSQEKTADPQKNLHKHLALMNSNRVTRQALTYISELVVHIDFPVGR